jgi:hypothetical protein
MFLNKDCLEQNIEFLYAVPDLPEKRLRGERH